MPQEPVAPEVPLVERSRLVKLLRSMGILSSEEDENSKSDTTEAPARRVPVAIPPPPAVPVHYKGEERVIEVPVAVPVPIPVEPGVNPLSKMSSVLPTYFLAKRANAQYGYNADGSSRAPGEGSPTPTVDTPIEPPDMGDTPSSSALAAPVAVNTPPSVGPSGLKDVNSDGTISLENKVASEGSRRDPFTSMLMSKFAQDEYQYYAGGLAPGASMLVAGLGGYGGAQVGDALAGMGTERAAGKQLANVESQIMELVDNPYLSPLEKRRMLKELNREAALTGVGLKSRAWMPKTPGQAEASFKRMRADLSRQLKAKRLPAARGLGVVAGAAAPFVLPDFLRNLGVI